MKEQMTITDKSMYDVNYDTEFSIGNTKFNIFVSIAEENVALDDASEEQNTPIFHDHYYCEILSSFAEKFTVYTKENCSFPIEKRNIVILRAGFPHATTLSKKSLPNSFGFTFKKIDDKNPFAQTFESFESVFSTDYLLLQEKETIDVFEQIAQRILYPTEFSYYSLPLLLQLFFIKIVEQQAPKRNSLTTLGPLDYRISVEINSLKPNVTLKSTAQKLFISERQLERRIRQLYGKSFLEKQKEIRMENAKKLLSSTLLTMDEIAAELNYSSASAFIVAFNRYVGVTPAKYRRNHKEENNAPLKKSKRGTHIRV